MLDLRKEQYCVYDAAFARNDFSDVARSQQFQDLRGNDFRQGVVGKGKLLHLTAYANVRVVPVVCVNAALRYAKKQNRNFK